MLTPAGNRGFTASSLAMLTPAGNRGFTAAAIIVRPRPRIAGVTVNFLDL
jgi:hypothetical protein